MNRKHEFEAMIQELNQPATGLEGTLDRAYKRKRKRTTQMIVHPVAGFAACFAIFVLLVNFCAPVAYACSRLPALKELAEAVTFSRSLTDAVENEYVQPMDLSQTQNDITAEIAYLIVDQKQVNVFFRLDSPKYSHLNANPGILNADGRSPFLHSMHDSGLQENGGLHTITIDFLDSDVPDNLHLVLHVFSNKTHDPNTAPESISDSFFSNEPEPLNYLADFEFVLEFDPKFTAAAKLFPVNQTVILDNQVITITDVEVYPSHMRVNIQESLDNSAYLKRLDFYIETDGGERFEPVSSGITSTGSIDSPSMISYRADSTYFYEAKHLKLVITGAQWLRKDMEKTYLNLVTGEHSELPEGAEFDSARKENGYWIVTFRADWKEDTPMYQLFRHKFYDAEGKEYEINQWSSMQGDADEEGNITYFYDEFPLLNYPYDEVWLTPQYSHNWFAENPIIIPIQQHQLHRLP